jgi:hypothetical protein
MIVVMWLLALIVIIVSTVLLEPKYLRTLGAYTNLGIVNYYLNARWYHAIIFPASSAIFAYFWTILSAQLYLKKGEKVAELFVFLSYFILFTLGVVAVRVLLFNAELS